MSNIKNITESNSSVSPSKESIGGSDGDWKKGPAKNTESELTFQRQEVIRETHPYFVPLLHVLHHRFHTHCP